MMVKMETIVMRGGVCQNGGGRVRGGGCRRIIIVKTGNRGSGRGRANRSVMQNMVCVLGDYNTA